MTVSLAEATAAARRIEAGWACGCGHGRNEHRRFGGIVAYAECEADGCGCRHYITGLGFREAADLLADYVLAGDTERLRAALERGWEDCPRFTLCRDTGERAVHGCCPVHGGDACLFEYVQVSALKRLAFAAEGNP